MRALIPLLLAAFSMLPRFADAGTIAFQLSLTGTELIVTNQGDSSAFYPSVFKMVESGRWQQLALKAPRAELVPRQRLQLAWPDAGKQGNLAALEQMQPVMVSFFDQAGVGFGQISFFHGPPLAKERLKAGYEGGELFVERPSQTSPIRSTWVLWSAEEGIGPIRRPVRFELQPPAAKRIEWRNVGERVFRLRTGAGRPAAILLHETKEGYFMQHVANGGLQGREQRAAWLDARLYLNRAAQFAFAAGAGLIGLHLALRLTRRRRA